MVYGGISERCASGYGDLRMGTSCAIESVERDHGIEMAIRQKYLERSSKNKYVIQSVVDR